MGLRGRKTFANVFQRGGRGPLNQSNCFTSLTEIFYNNILKGNIRWGSEAETLSRLCYNLISSGVIKQIKLFHWFDEFFLHYMSVIQGGA